ncbi:MAG: bifunctional alpha,alpha-trehalose-phosphate synthase (UDP-forming)/trehalose-phosphatase [bacterium]|nr:bifunctional alpha,alpha-trehalose-phosphate synthase (UDP-forming)/trehalose-phosphatase [bacterium]
MSSAQWIIVSNRLPLQYDAAKGKITASSGGLVTAVNGIKTKNRKLWIGAASQELAEGLAVRKPSSDPLSYHPVVVEEDLFDAYYNGYCNDVLWPLLHYESNLVRHLASNWDAYVEVNRRFAEEILKVAEPGDLVWIHDFHLFLLPGMLRQMKKKFRVGFFLHVPFPTSEIFRQLPTRKEILTSLLAADVVGFHDYSYLRHFASGVYSTLGLETDLYSITHEGHKAQLGVFPVSIDTHSIIKKSNAAPVKGELARLQQGLVEEQVVLGVDRLDYIKGIDLKFQAFERMLELYPKLRGKVQLVQIAVPSRTDVPEYKGLKSRLEEMVGSINGKFGDIAHSPIHYLYSSIPNHQLLALYRLADTLLVTSKRDGMNLVCLEFVAAQNKHNPGNILLSEFAGAISTLSHVMPINPWNIDETAHRLAEALKMGLAERRRRQNTMLDFLKSYTATDWATTFRRYVDHVTQPEEDHLTGQVLKPKAFVRKLAALRGNKPLVIFMDYDGTLVTIRNRPEDAILKANELDLLKQLAKKRQVRLVITSGRPRDFLEKQLGRLKVDMAGEHGAKYYDHQKRTWNSLVTSDLRWYDDALNLMTDFANRVPDSFVERKDYALVFHYRNSPKDFARYQAIKLHFELEAALAKSAVTVIEGKMNIEVRCIEADKGHFCRWYLHQIAEQGEEVLPIAIGDDRTDEDMFSVIQEGGYAVKIGTGSTLAKYQTSRQSQVYDFIKELIEAVD